MRVINTGLPRYIYLHKKHKYSELPAKAIGFHGFGGAGSVWTRGVSSNLLTNLSLGHKAQIDTPMISLLPPALLLFGPPSGRAALQQQNLF